MAFQATSSCEQTVGLLEMILSSFTGGVGDACLLLGPSSIASFAIAFVVVVVVAQLLGSYVVSWLLSPDNDGYWDGDEPLPDARELGDSLLKPHYDGGPIKSTGAWRSLVPFSRRETS